MELSNEVKQIVNDLTATMNNCNIPPPKEDELDLRQFLQYPLIEAYCKGIKNRANVQVRDEGTYEYPAAIELRDNKGEFIFETEFLEKLSTRITNEIEGINRVVIDITNSLY